MESIRLQQVIPEVFAGRLPADISDLWERDILFRKGETYLIEAASGTGKSSLCSFLYGFRNDYRGRIRFDETGIETLSPKQWERIRQQSLSILFQELRLFPELTALENVLLKNDLTGYRSRQEIDAFFEMLDIGDKKNEPVGRLSLGQQQRTALIRALCQPFDFILLDEPVSHTDEENSRRMGALLARETARNGAGVIVTSIGKRLPLNYRKTLRL